MAFQKIERQFASSRKGLTLRGNLLMVSLMGTGDLATWNALTYMRESGKMDCRMETENKKSTITTTRENFMKDRSMGLAYKAILMVVDLRGISRIM